MKQCLYESKVYDISGGGGNTQGTNLYISRRAWKLFPYPHKEDVGYWVDKKDVEMIKEEMPLSEAIDGILDLLIDICKELEKKKEEQMFKVGDKVLASINGSTWFATEIVEDDGRLYRVKDYRDGKENGCFWCVAEDGIKRCTPEEWFFERVKGHKIRWSNWAKDEYAIPTEREGAIIKSTFWNGTKMSSNSHSICNGFDEENGCKWEFYKEEKKMEMKEFFDKVRGKKIKFGAGLVITYTGIDEAGERLYGRREPSMLQEDDWHSIQGWISNEGWNFIKEFTTLKVTSLQHTIEFHKDFVHVGCQKITKEDAKKISNELIAWEERGWK